MLEAEQKQLEVESGNIKRKNKALFSNLAANQDSLMMSDRFSTEQKTFAGTMNNASNTTSAVGEMHSLY